MLKFIMKSLKNIKVPEEDFLLAKIMKKIYILTCGPLLTDLFIHINNVFYIPDRWKLALIVPIYNNGIKKVF